MSRLTPEQQLQALGSLRASEMEYGDMSDAAMYRRRVKSADAEPLSEKEAEHIDQIFKRYFE